LQAGTAAAAAGPEPVVVVELVTSRATDEDTKLEMERGQEQTREVRTLIKYKIHFFNIDKSTKIIT
jgi:hypothetical protein